MLKSKIFLSMTHAFHMYWFLQTFNMKDRVFELEDEEPIQKGLKVKSPSEKSSGLAKLL